MNKKLLFLPLIVLTGVLATSCAFDVPEIMKKSSGFNFVGRGGYNSINNPIFVNSYEELTVKGTELIASEYQRFYFKLTFNGASSKTALDIFNVFEIDAHISALEIEAYNQEYNCLHIDADTRMQKNWTLEFIVSYSMGAAASYRTKETLSNKWYGQINGNMLLRMAKYEDRGDAFEDFPIDYRTKEFSIRNSEELWWACENGFKPVFLDSNSRAYLIYKEAKNICRTYIKTGMTDFEKALTLYDYITTKISYDYDCLDDKTAWQKNVSYFLEGPFAYQRGVCDAFSKMFSLLGSIEELDILRGFGYNFVGGEIESGHAWNYVSLDDRESWYLLCTTWGRSYERVSDSLPSNVCVTSYHPAFTSYHYFKDNSDYDFKEMVWENYTKNTTPIDIADNDTFIYHSNEYDYKIDYYEELEATINAMHDLGITEPYSLCLESGNIDFKYIMNTPKGPNEHPYKTQFKAKLREYGYDSYYFFDTNSSYSNKTFTILIAK